jgi:hypothetical protein
MRFLNQKLGKRTSRKFDLLKSRLASEKQPYQKLRGSDSKFSHPAGAAPRFPKKGTSREGKV